MDKLESKTEEERNEIAFKKKHKLFGNIDFVGELYKKSMLSEGILKSVFVNLLGMQSTNTGQVNDDTIEAAIKILTKLGPEL